MELVLGALVLLLIIGMWLAGSRRQRTVDAEQRAVLERLEGQRVTADVVVGLAPMTRGVQLVATATFLLGPLHGNGSRVGVSDVRVSEIDGRDANAVAAALERDGVDVRDVLSVTGPDGEQHDFNNVQHPRRGRHGPGQ